MNLPRPELSSRALPFEATHIQRHRFRDLKRESGRSGLASLVPSTALNSLIGSRRAQAAGTEPLTEEMYGGRARPEPPTSAVIGPERSTTERTIALEMSGVIRLGLAPHPV